MRPGRGHTCNETHGAEYSLVAHASVYFVRTIFRFYISCNAEAEVLDMQKGQK